MVVTAWGGTMLLLFLRYPCHLSILILLQSGYPTIIGQSTPRCHPVYYHLPECVNHPDGYGCKCGPGFIWNTHMCVAAGLDSRLAFDTNTTLRYAGVVNKPFPELTSFTISFWLRLNSSRHPGTVLSYSGHDGSGNVLRVLSGPYVVLQILDETIRTDLRLNESQWTHLAWTWTSKGGTWRLYVDGARLTLKGRAARADRPISGGGELVLGQSSRSPNDDHGFDLRYAFIGDIAFANIWRRVMPRVEVKTLKEDCEMMKCGDVIEWADFRSGTRGDMKIRWPSKIYKRPCFDEEHSGQTCDRHCSVTYGPRCNKETRENIIWERTPADHNATVICPGTVNERRENITAHAYRECIKISHSKGIWLKPIMTECTSPELLHFRHLITKWSRVNPLNESEILLLAESFYSLLKDQIYDNAIDISACVDILTVILNAQVDVLYKVVSKNVSKAYGIYRSDDQLVYPTLNDTYSIIEVFIKVINRLLADGNDPGWLGSEPKGHEGDRLLKVTKRIDHLIADSLALHVSRGEILPNERAEMSFIQDRIALQVKIYKTEKLDNLVYPNTETLEQFRHLKGNLSADKQAILSALNGTIIPEYLTISLGMLDASKTLPNRNLTGKYIKEDNVNSNLFYMNIHEAEYECDVEENRTEDLAMMKFEYLDNFNISNPECVRLINSDRSNKWHWSRDGCLLDHNTTTYCMCHCRPPGVFAVITDMYNLDWDKGERPMILMDIPSYIGCSLSALLCLLSGILLIYYRTSSKTAALHKNFALSITCSQLSFMFGVDKTEHELACHIFAIAFHYFFLSTFSWLMNEAFNLYIVITYAAHSHGEHTEAGSQWRYYILGWILPGILVGAFVGTYQNDYYADDMCWIAWEHVWLFLGPAIGIISVTILVLIFIAKEHHESAYSKNEETNNMIIVYAKALWTQTILISLCWSFAFLSIRMRGIIIKCLYALFNGLQGAFFLVFYFLLHDEVQTVIKARVKKQSLAKQGYGESLEEDSVAFAHELEELTSPGMSGSGCRQKVNSQSTPPRATHYSSDESEQSEDDILVTSV